MRMMAIPPLPGFGNSQSGLRQSSTGSSARRAFPRSLARHTIGASRRLIRSHHVDNFRKGTRFSMSEHSYKMIELVGSSHTSIEAAVQNAIAKAEQDESKLRWFEVVETRGHIEDGKIAHWQVRVKIGATLPD